MSRLRNVLSVIREPTDNCSALRRNIAKEGRLTTDQARLYRKIDKEFAEHPRMLRAGFEYVCKGNPTIHTNTVEGSFSIFKRGMRGVYQHASKKHLHRYVAEFDFRYSHRAATGVDDQGRARLALAGVVGKRLTYRGGANVRRAAAI